MKKFLELLFGKVGLLISAALMSAVSWFLFPKFIGFVTGKQLLSNIVGWVMCPFAVGFVLSAVLSSFSLFVKGIKDKQWWWIVLGLVVLAFDIFLIVMSFKRW